MHQSALLFLLLGLVVVTADPSSAFAGLIKAINGNDAKTALSYYDPNVVLNVAYTSQQAGNTGKMLVLKGANATKSLSNFMTASTILMQTTQMWKGATGTNTLMVSGNISYTGKGGSGGIPSTVTCTNQWFYAIKFNSNDKMTLIWDYTNPQKSVACSNKIAAAKGQTSEEAEDELDLEVATNGHPEGTTLNEGMFLDEVKVNPSDTQAMKNVKAYFNAFASLNPDAVTPIAAPSMKVSFPLLPFSKSETGAGFVNGLKSYLTCAYVKFAWTNIEFWPTADPNFIWVRVMPVAYLAGAPADGSMNYRNHYFMGFGWNSNNQMITEIVVYNPDVAAAAEKVVAKYGCSACDLQTSLTWTNQDDCGAYQSLQQCWGKWNTLAKMCGAQLTWAQNQAKANQC